jgi:2-phospho-L-lactate/phosphoenolpyruvate guanylyltransferase
MPDVSDDGDQWSLLVPVKRLDLAKSRLDLDAGPRADLALAMAVDTVRAALAARAVAEVVVITDDQRAGAALSGVGARVVADSPDAGLNPALIHGASVAVMPRVAALSSDLPALRADDLDAALHEAAEHRVAVVGDVAGTGTTMFASTVVADFKPSFGVNSRRTHVAAGAADLTERTAVSVRHDVDTIAALKAAVGLGVGAETTQVLRGLPPLG